MRREGRAPRNLDYCARWEWSAHALAATFLGKGPYVPIWLRFGLWADLYPLENRRIVVSVRGVISCLWFIRSVSVDHATLAGPYGALAWVTYQNNCRTCVTAAYCCEMRRRLMFDLLILRCLLFNNVFSTARVTWRRMTGCICITNGKRRDVLQGIVPAVAGRYWGKLNPSHNGRFENWDSHLGAFEHEAGHGICTF